MGQEDNKNQSKDSEGYQDPNEQKTPHHGQKPIDEDLDDDLDDDRDEDWRPGGTNRRLSIN